MHSSSLQHQRAGTVRSSSPQVTGWWSGAGAAAQWDTSISRALAPESGGYTLGQTRLLVQQSKLISS